jgi:predicted enzyme related to lactoylglutathione lyase
MTILRIVADLPANDPGATAAWYAKLFDLDVKMDMDWIVTMGTETSAPVQLSIAREGGAGTPVPHLSIEVNNLDETHAKAQDLGVEITYPLTQEPWGVRRFFARDPEGRILNILSHTGAPTGATQ